MRVLVTTFPAVGHFHSVAPLALALRAAGHDVCVATSPDLVPWVTTCGLPSRAVGPLLRGLIAQVSQEPSAAERTLSLMTDVWPRAVVEDLVRLCEQWQPGVVVHEEGEYAAVVAASRAGVPCVTQSWAVPGPAPHQRLDVLRRLQPLWERFAPSSPAAATGQLYLDACPPALQHNGFGDLDQVVSVVPVRATPFDGPAARTPSWLSALPRPTAYVTLGAQPDVSRPDLLATLARGAAARAASVVVTTGPNDPTSLGSLPDNVVARTYLPQSRVLPHADVVVSHGGAGGTVGALQHTLPQLVVPGHDEGQQGVAAVVAGIGAGLRLRADQRDAETVREAVTTLLRDVRFELAASRVRDQMERLPAPADVVDQVTDLGGRDRA